MIFGMNLLTGHSLLFCSNPLATIECDCLFFKPKRLYLYSDAIFALLFGIICQFYLQGAGTRTRKTSTEDENSSSCFHQKSCYVVFVKLVYLRSAQVRMGTGEYGQFVLMILF